MQGQAYAQYNAVPADRAFQHLPDGITSEQAVAVLLQGLTALTIIREAGEVTPERVAKDNPWTLVHAAAGGTGGLAVQILRAFGAKIIATAGSKEKTELATKNGADYVINSQEEDVAARVKEITGGHGVDVIFDGVGKSTFDMDLDIIARKGTLVMFGNAVSGTPCLNLEASVDSFLLVRQGAAL